MNGCNGCLHAEKYWHLIVYITLLAFNISGYVFALCGDTLFQVPPSSKFRQVPPSSAKLRVASSKVRVPSSVSSSVSSSISQVPLQVPFQVPLAILMKQHIFTQKYFIGFYSTLLNFYMARMPLLIYNNVTFLQASLWNLSK